MKPASHPFTDGGSTMPYRMDGETLAQRRNYDLLYSANVPGNPSMRRDVHWVGDGAGHLVSGAPTPADCFPARIRDGVRNA